jgi:3-oxoacyl-[acyl-carrier protein] reductase
MDRTVLITGAAGGLGLRLTKRFLDLGDFVFGITRSKNNWGNAKKRLGSSERFHLSQGDISQEKAVKRFISQVRKKNRRIDIVINNAGYVDVPTRVEDLRLTEIQKNLNANLVSVFLMCKHVLPTLQKQGQGLIVNISSMAGKRAVPRLSAYSASKFGVLAVSQSVAKENEGRGIKCVTICPGGINTAMRAKVFGGEDAKKQQSADFVSDAIMKVVSGEIEVPSGGDIVIRHGEIKKVCAAPAP